MAYTPNPTDTSQPVGSVKAKTAAAEFRAIKEYLNSIVAAGLPPVIDQDGKVLTVVNGVVVWGEASSMYDFYTCT